MSPSITNNFKYKQLSELNTESVTIRAVAQIYKPSPKNLSR